MHELDIYRKLSEGMGRKSTVALHGVTKSLQLFSRFLDCRKSWVRVPFILDFSTHGCNRDPDFSSQRYSGGLSHGRLSCSALHTAVLFVQDVPFLRYSARGNLPQVHLCNAGIRKKRFGGKTEAQDGHGEGDTGREKAHGGARANEGTAPRKAAVGRSFVHTR